jgi:hypothetical protein
MNAEQIIAIKCAYADLVGALQAYNQGEVTVHDWEAHYQTIRDLEVAFPTEIEPVEIA